MSAHLVAVDSEDRVIFVTFKAFEEVWKFTTYFTHGNLGMLCTFTSSFSLELAKCFSCGSSVIIAKGRLGHCMEHLLFDHKMWLLSLENRLGIEVSAPEDTLHAIYTCVLMQEGTFIQRGRSSSTRPRK